MKVLCRVRIVCRVLFPVLPVCHFFYVLQALWFCLFPAVFGRQALQAFAERYRFLRRTLQAVPLFPAVLGQQVPKTVVPALQAAPANAFVRPALKEPKTDRLLFVRIVFAVCFLNVRTELNGY